MKPNSVTERIIWGAMVICAVAAAIVLFVQDSPSQAVALGCAALVLAIIGGSARGRASRSGKR